MPPPEGSSIAGLARGVAEPLLALAAAFAVTLLLTLPFVPQHVQINVRLSPEGAAPPAAHEELERQVAGLGLAERVQVLLVGGGSHLVLSGVVDSDRAEREVRAALARSGYRQDDLEVSRVANLEGLMRGDARGLPLVITIQAVVLALAGLLLARGRVLAVPVAGSQTRAAALGVGAGLVAIAFSAALGALLKALGLPVEEQAWLEELFKNPGAVLRLSPWVVLVAPLSEELFFRHYVLRFISTHAGLSSGVVLSSLMFATIHFNASGLLIYLGIGVIFAWVYQRTGRILASVVAHATLNAVVLVGSLLSAGVRP